MSSGSNGPYNDGMCLIVMPNSMKYKKVFVVPEEKWLQLDKETARLDNKVMQLQIRMGRIKAMIEKFPRKYELNGDKNLVSYLTRIQLERNKWFEALKKAMEDG